METSLQLHNLKTGYRLRGGKQKIISKNLNATLQSGTLTSLLGPNGAGKSTLLKTLTGALRPIEGSVEIFAKNVHSLPAKTIANLIGVVLTDRINSENLTIRQLVEMGRSPYTGLWGKLSKEDRQICEESITLIGLEQLANKKIYNLSDGERQKAMIAKCLAQSTPIIFLDEPTAFLDYPSKVELMLLLKKLAVEKDKTILLSTHDLDMALQLSDNLWLIDKNLGFTEGSANMLAESGVLSRYFNSEALKLEKESLRFKFESIS